MISFFDKKSLFAMALAILCLSGAEVLAMDDTDAVEGDSTAPKFDGLLKNNKLTIAEGIADTVRFAAVALNQYYGKNLDKDSKKALLVGMSADLTRIISDTLFMLNSTKHAQTEHRNKVIKATTYGMTTPWLLSDLRSFGKKALKLVTNISKDKKDLSFEIPSVISNNKKQKVRQIAEKLKLFLPVVEGLALAGRIVALKTTNHRPLIHHKFDLVMGANALLTIIRSIDIQLSSDDTQCTKNLIVLNAVGAAVLSMILEVIVIPKFGDKYQGI